MHTPVAQPLAGVRLPDRTFWKHLFGQYRRLLKFVRPYRWRLVGAGSVLVLNSLLGLVLPWVVQNIVDTAFTHADLQFLNRITGGLFLLFAVRAVLEFVQIFLLSWVAERVVADLRQRLYAHIHAMPLRFFNSIRVGDLVSRLGNDVATIQDAVTGTLLGLVSQLVTLVGGMAIIFAIDWRLTLLMLGTVPAALIGWYALGRQIRRISRQAQDELAEITAVAEEALAGVRTVKSFAREPYEVGRYSAGVERLFRVALKRVKVRAVLSPMMGLLAFGSIAVVLWFGGRGVIQGRLTPGELVSFLLYTLIVAGPIAVLTTLYGQLQQALGASERVFELLDTTPEMRDAPGAQVLPAVQGLVRFENVSFDYGDGHRAQEVLRGVSVVAQPGQVIALVGPSGAGKTTLVNLIPRFYDPTQGRILIDGHDLRNLRIQSLREQIGVVPQEPVLFSGSVRENIAYGKLNATAQEIEAAARAANAHEFVMQLDAGYDTAVGERGTRLSGGQRQRIAIARAILKDPRILILDEATSSLDSESEQAVQEALERLMCGRTTFVIAHRLSTIIRADRIVVLDDGRVVEEGTHADLIALGGLYRRLHVLQFEAGAAMHRATQ